MVKMYFKTVKARQRAWQKAGGSKTIPSTGALREAHWVGDKGIDFPTIRSGSAKHRILVKELK